MPADQLQLFEPTGQQVLDLAAKHERDAKQCRYMAALYDQRGWGAVSHKLYRMAFDCEDKAAHMHMLAEFEALGGVS